MCGRGRLSVWARARECVGEGVWARACECVGEGGV